MTDTEGKRINRADLQTPPTTTPLCAEFEELLNEKLAALYGPIITKSVDRNSTSAATFCFDPVTAATCRSPLFHPNELWSGDIQDENQVSNADHVYEFYLFSQPYTSSPQRIILEQEYPITDDITNASLTSGFVVPNRNKNFYFSTQVSGEYSSTFLLSAVEGETVKQWSKKRAWGLEVPWRVQIVRVPHDGKTKKTNKVTNTIRNDDLMTNIIPTALQTQCLIQENRPLTTEKKRKMKPGKKQRIAMRKKNRALAAEEELKSRITSLKLIAEKEKKIRRNQGKKIKRKLKRRKQANVEE